MAKKLKRTKRKQPLKSGDHSPSAANAISRTLGVAIAHHQQGELDTAITLYKRILSQQPRHADALHLLGLAALQQGDSDAAEKLIQKAIAINPDVAAYHSNLSVVLRDLSRFDEALSACQQALFLRPESASAYYNRGLAFAGLDDFSAAIDDFARSLVWAPGDSRLRNTQGASAARDHCLSSDVLSSVEQLESALANQALSTEQRMHFHLALAKHCAENRAYDEAFHHFAANHLNRALYHHHHYDTNVERTRMNCLRQTLSAEFFSQRSDWGNPSRRPIFVVGMPRSGTTLTEQILASHSRVYGAGELDALEGLKLRLTRGLSFHEFGQRLAAMTADEAADMAADYLAFLDSLDQHAERVVDKMPHNFERLWLVALLFPNAKVVHCERDAMATCWSIYSTSFSRAHPYSDDLVSLGEHYRDYQTLMTHWHDVLPLEIYSLKYESLVNEPEETISALLDYCDLPFEPACLEPHKTKRQVKTASINQVTKPLYQYANAQWRHYERHLAPLIEVLERPS